MNKITIAVGTKRGPKLNAVVQALESISEALAHGAEFDIIGVEVESGVSHTPASGEELMRGARQRAEAVAELARRNDANWQYCVGLEGGLEVFHDGVLSNAAMRSAKQQHTGQRRVFLESWAYVCDGTRGHFGRSGSIELPEALAHEVLENGVELATAIDQFAGAVGIRDAQGAWGVLSGNSITRQEAFRVAVIAAFAPFYNGKMYSAKAAAATGASR